MEGGANDYIVTRDGQQRAVRSLQPNGNFKVTRLIRHNVFQGQVHSNAGAHSDLVTGTRRNGNAFEREDWLPVEALGLGLIRQNDALSDRDKMARAKQRS